MPRPRQERQVPHERFLAQQWREAREAKGWSLEDVARHMTNAGCPMDRSAVYRVESGEPPRRINVDEAATFANLVGIGLEHMLLPPAVARSREATKLFKRYLDARSRFEAASNEMRGLEHQLLDIADAGYEDEVTQALENVPRDARGQDANVLMGFWRVMNNRFPEDVVKRWDTLANQPRPDGVSD